MSAARESPVRVLLGVGDRELERRLTQELPAEGVLIVARCLDGPSLLERAQQPGVDVVLAAADLHHLTDATLLALRERRRPVVLLVTDPSDTERLAALARVVPASASSSVIAAAVQQAEAHGSGYADVSGPLLPDSGDTDEDEARGRVITVASGKGAPGKTTVAIALASSLAGQGLRVVLVDADLRGGNVAPYVDLDPRRGLVGLAAGGGPLSGRLAEELQDGPGFRVLAGVERTELASGLREDTLAAVIGALREGFERVVVDGGVPPEPAVLRGADEVLVVTGADLVSVWNARVGLHAIREAAGGAALSAVVNRREGREHYDRDEIERALGLAVLGVVREDRKAVRRAIAKQIPLSEAGGRAARDLRALAATVEAHRASEAAASERLQTSLVGER